MVGHQITLVNIVNKLEYLNKLLTMCTEDQVNMFNRIYPNQPTVQQVSTAIWQVENTLSNLNIANDKVRKIKVQYENQLDEQAETILKRDRDIVELNDTINNLRHKIKLMESNVDEASMDTKERLDKLDRLEAGGVDNWEWYDEAMNGNCDED